jgi:uncharacterized protein with HEPN domain
VGSKTLIYKRKVEQNLNESYKHLDRLNGAFEQLSLKYNFPLNQDSYDKIINNINDLAFSDQVIYRFSKLQDTIGAKLFKSLLLYQGENVNKPFLDILNSLERIDIIDVEEWFEIRDLRNEIAHEYEESENMAINILNTIYELKQELEKILNRIKEMV